MSHHVYKHITLTGTSDTTIEDAVRHAVVQAGKSVRNHRWLEVQETRARLGPNGVEEWQVTIRLAFTIDDSD